VARVLVVDDDLTIGGVVVGYLARGGHEAQHVTDGAKALDAIAAEPPDLVVLDLMLPGTDGLDVCRQVRLQHTKLPIIMLTALAEAEDRIAGLELGADDYVTKPFSPRELILRIESVLRRTSDAPAPRRVLRAGSITLDTEARVATRVGSELSLTVREFDLIAYLMTHPGRAFSRAELMRQVWGWTFGDQSTVTVHVRRLREKLEVDPANPSLIKTVWGVGYRLELP
jgi:two-component system, OmpR family, response regulator ResD